MTILTMFLCFGLFILGILSYYWLYSLIDWIGDLRYKRHIKNNPNATHKPLECAFLVTDIGGCESEAKVKKGGK